MKTIFAILVCVIVVFPLLASADQPSARSKKDPCSDPREANIICPVRSVWAKFSRISLDMSDNPQTFRARWLLEYSKDKDMKLSVDQLGQTGTSKGQIMVVSGKIMLTTGLDLKEGYEIDALDGPILMMQLTMGLLESSFPDGPKMINKQTALDLEEKTKSIRVATRSAGGMFSPPWKVKGTANKTSETVTFDLHFSTQPLGAAKGMDANLRGAWDQAPAAFQPEDTMPLEGWKVYRLGVRTIKMKGGTRVDYGASPESGNFQTLGDLRKAVAAEGRR
jgi:hypothetical protein